MITQEIFLVKIIVDNKQLLVGCYSNIDCASKIAKEIYRKYLCKNIVNIYKCPLDKIILDYNSNIIKPIFIIKTLDVIHPV